MPENLNPLQIALLVGLSEGRFSDVDGTLYWDFAKSDDAIAFFELCYEYKWYIGLYHWNTRLVWNWRIDSFSPRDFR